MKFSYIDIKYVYIYIYSNLLNFQYEIIVPSIGFMVSWIQNMKKIYIIKVGDKYVWNWSYSIWCSNTFLHLKM
jgi:hypothetical protein